MMKGRNVSKLVSASVLFMLIIVIVGPLAFATEYYDPEIFVIAENANNVHGSGWFAGYVVYGTSGTYTLDLSATGNEDRFPIVDVKVIVLVSDEAQAGGLASLSIEGTPIIGYTEGQPAYYGANGGPFAEPDYYGYNDTYTIPELTYAQVHYPDNSYELSITVVFSSTATLASKVEILCYGTNGVGALHPTEWKTPFSGGTTFVIPYIASTAAAVAAVAGAFGLYKIKRKKSA